MALCRIIGTVYLPNGQPAASQEIQFYKADTKIKADYLGAVLPDVVTVMTSPTGGIAVDLLTGYYKMYSKTDTITAFGKVTVPDALTANISDILVAEVLPEPNPVWLDQVQVARDEVLDNATIAENAAELAVQTRTDFQNTVDGTYIRKNYFYSEPLTTSVPWVSSSQITLGHSSANQAMTVSATPGTSPSNWGSFYWTSSSTYFRITNTKVLKILLNAVAPTTTGTTGLNPSIRVVLVTRNAAGAATTAYLDFKRISNTYADYIWYFKFPTDAVEYRWSFQVSNLIDATNVPNTFYVKKVALEDGPVSSSKEVNELTLEVASRSQVLNLTATDISSYNVIVDKETGLRFKVVAGNIPNAPLAFSAYSLVPAGQPNLMHWTGTPDGQYNYSGPTGFEDEVISMSGTNHWLNLLKAYRYSMANGKSLEIPDGVWYCRNDTSAPSYTNTELENLVIKGNGRRSSVILFDDMYNTANSGRRDMLPIGRVARINISGVSFIGSWRGKSYVAGVTTTSASSHFLTGGAKSEILLNSVEFEGCGYFSVATSARRFEAINCRVSYGYADGLHCNASEYYRVSNCSFYRVMDDTVAAHFDEVIDSGYVGNPEPMAVVIGNTFEQCQGIAINGAKRMVVSGNVGKHIYTRWIATSHANLPYANIIISDNIVEGGLNQQVLTTMGVLNIDTYPSNLLPSAGGDGMNFITLNSNRSYYSSSSSQVISFSEGTSFVFESTGTTVLQPNGFFDKEYTNEGQVNWLVGIRGNQIRDTYEYGKKFSEQKSNEKASALWSRWGKINPTLVPGTDSTAGIYVVGMLVDVVIADNIVFGPDTSLMMGAAPSHAANSSSSNANPNAMLSNVKVANNTFKQAVTQVVYVAGSGEVEFVNNTLDGDPLFLSNSRNPNGTFNSTGTDTTIAIRSNPGTNFPAPSLKLTNNTFKNVKSVFDGRASVWGTKTNSFYGEFVTKSSTLNKGIENLPTNLEELGYTVTEGSDPTDKANFKKITSTPKFYSNAAPTTGFYCIGDFVRNISPTVVSNSILLGWVKLSTDANNSNWSPVRATVT